MREKKPLQPCIDGHSFTSCSSTDPREPWLVLESQTRLTRSCGQDSRQNLQCCPESTIADGASSLGPREGGQMGIGKGSFKALLWKALLELS